jgi:sugar O-acyltransferase (sialic acid O-acetyltransferase NeuD family)
MENYKEIFIPKETVSDDSVSIVELNSSSGAEVSKGDIIFAIETSKSVIEIESPISGLISHKLKLSESIPVGELAAIISLEQLSNKALDKLYDCTKEVNSNKESHNDIKVKKISKKALDFIEKEGLDINKFSNIPFVRVKDVEAFMINNDTSIVDDNDVKYSENDIVLIGGGGHAKMCIDIINRMQIYNIVGIIDNNIGIGEIVSGTTVIGSDEILQGLYKKGLRLAVNAIGSIKVRTEIFNKLRKIGFSIPNLIHPMSIVEPSAILMEGVQIMMGASVGSDCKIGENCIINSGAIISHDSNIGMHSHIAPGAILAGNVTTGSSVLIGMGATVFISVNIGKNAIINNGENIFSDVEKDKVVKK